MRETAQADGIQIQLTAGTYVVPIGVSVGVAHAEGLLGFPIEPTDRLLDPQEPSEKDIV